MIQTVKLLVRRYMYAGIVRPTREGGNMVGNPVLGNWTDGFGCYQQDFQDRVNSVGIM